MATAKPVTNMISIFLALLCISIDLSQGLTVSLNGTNGISNPGLTIDCTRPAYWIDDATAKAMSTAFCNDLEDNFPKLQGDTYRGSSYPCGLPAYPGRPDYLEMEESGLIAEFEFMRGAGILINNTIIIEGSNDQCARDSCQEVFQAMVNRCEWNSHSYGGFNTAITRCGMYIMFVQNCTNNIVDPHCRRWHQQYQPDFTGIQLPTSSFTVDILTTIGPNFTSRFVMTYVTELSMTKHLPLTPSTISGGNVTLIPFTFAPASTKPG